MATNWARLGIAIGAAAVGGLVTGGATWAISAGFLAGTYVGNLIFPTEYESKMPPVHDYPVQASSAGSPIPIVYGTTRLAGNVIWMSNLTAYQIKHSAGGGKGGGDEQATFETRYRRSFLIAICEGPAKILRAWRGKGEMPLSEFTSYDGDNNSGISTLIGKKYAEYSNLCLAYFEDYELGNAQNLPNFVFEVSTNFTIQQYPKIIYTGGSRYNNKNFWKITDDGTSLSISDSWDLLSDGQLKSFDYDAVNDRFICAFNTPPYYLAAFKRSDMSLDTSWGTAGKVTIGKHVNQVAIDNQGYCCAVHQDLVGPVRRITFLNPNGGISWQVAGYKNYPYCVAFDANKNLIIGYGYPLDAAIIRYSRGDGSAIQTIRAGEGVAYNYWIDHVSAHPSDPTLLSFGWRKLTPPYASKFYVWNSDSGELWNHDFGAVEAGALGSYRMPDSNRIIYGCAPGKVYIADYLTGNNRIEGGANKPIKPKAVADESQFYLTTIDGYLISYNVDITQIDNVHPSIANLWNLVIFEPDVKIFQSGDKNFAKMIKDLLTNKKCGGYEESDLIAEDFNDIIAYCEANNLKGSLTVTAQRPLPDWISYICSHFQGYFYEIGGKVGLNCYRSQNSVLPISQDDLARTDDEPPVHTTKRVYSSTFNRIEATWTDRDNDYKTAVVTAFDRIDQRESGQVRTKTIDLKAITNKQLAAKMVWRVFIDQIYRFSQYTFKLGYKSMLLEVGDVIDVTDGYSLVAKKMRTMSASEEKDGRIATITAIEDIADLYPIIEYSIQQSQTEGDSDITLTDGTIAFRESWLENKLYLSITPGGAQCNGFYIYRSYDDASYDLVGKAAIGGITGGEVNSIGTIQSSLPAYPTAVHRQKETIEVDIGTLTDLNTAITDDEFFNSRRLVRIGEEIIAYKTCVESETAGVWRVLNLRRGLFGTKAVAHVPGEPFKTLDVDFVYTIKESDIGKTLYFKVVSFYADKAQLLSEVSSQSYVLSGKYVKPLPVSLMRINGREGFSTYKTKDVTIDWYFCSKTSGFGRGGYGNALWGAYVKDPLLKRLKVELEDEDGTPIVDANYDLDKYGEPIQLEILEADRNGKNPVRVRLTPGSHLWSDEARDILIEKI